MLKNMARLIRFAVDENSGRSLVALKRVLRGQDAEGTVFTQSSPGGYGCGVALRELALAPARRYSERTTVAARAALGEALAAFVWSTPELDPPMRAYDDAGIARELVEPRRV